MELSLFDLVTETKEENEVEDLLNDLQEIKKDYESILGTGIFNLINSKFKAVHEEFTYFKEALEKVASRESYIFNRYDTEKNMGRSFKEYFLDSLKNKLKQEFMIDISIEAIRKEFDAYGEAVDKDIINKLNYVVNFDITRLYDIVANEIKGDINKTIIENSIKLFKNKFFQYDKLEVKNNKIEIRAYYFFSYSSEYSKQVDYEVSNIFFGVLQNFDSDVIKPIILNNYIHREKFIDLYSLISLCSDKVTGIRFYKNGKAEIIFKDNKTALEFKKYVGE
jgi:hypothetical protein